MVRRLPPTGRGHDSTGQCFNPQFDQSKGRTMPAGTLTRRRNNAPRSRSARLLGQVDRKRPIRGSTCLRGPTECYLTIAVAMSESYPSLSWRGHEPGLWPGQRKPADRALGPPWHVNFTPRLGIYRSSIFRAFRFYSSRHRAMRSTRGIT